MRGRVDLASERASALIDLRTTGDTAASLADDGKVEEALALVVDGIVPHESREKTMQLEQDLGNLRRRGRNLLLTHLRACDAQAASFVKQDEFRKAATLTSDYAQEWNAEAGVLQLSGELSELRAKYTFLASLAEIAERRRLRE
jgi:hypothetical protein